MHPRIESEFATLPGLLYRPAREAPRDFDDVLLRIPVVDPKRVKLHQLASVVLIDRANLLLALGLRSRLRKRAKPSLELLLRIGTRTLPVVEIEQHRRVMRD